MPLGASSLTVADIVARLGGELLGGAAAAQVRIAGVGTLLNAKEDQAAFLAQSKYRAQARDTQAGVVILSSADAQCTTRARIVSANPYAYFARLSRLLNPPPARAPGVHPSAIVEPGAQIDPSACVRALAHIGHDARIGPRVIVESGAVIGERVELGADCLIYPNVVIYADCRLGERVILHAGVIIGADGFGYAPSEGRWEKIPQIGRVLIGDDVEVGANTTIDRGALDDTVIEEGVKLDNQIQLGHNVRVGAHTVMAGCAVVAGSTRIGKHCRIGGAAMIAGHLEIADGVDISGGTPIIKSITKPGMYTGVFPFMTHERWLHNSVHLRRLDELAQQIKHMEQRLKALDSKPK